VPAADSGRLAALLALKGQKDTEKEVPGMVVEEISAHGLFWLQPSQVACAMSRLRP